VCNKSHVTNMLLCTPSLTRYRNGSLKRYDTDARYDLAIHRRALGPVETAVEVFHLGNASIRRFVPPRATIPGAYARLRSTLSFGNRPKRTRRGILSDGCRAQRESNRDTTSVYRVAGSYFEVIRHADEEGVYCHLWREMGAKKMPMLRQRRSRVGVRRWKAPSLFNASKMHVSPFSISPRRRAGVRS